MLSIYVYIFAYLCKGHLPGYSKIRQYPPRRLVGVQQNRRNPDI